MGKQNIIPVVFAVLLVVSGMPVATMNAQALTKNYGDGPAYSSEWAQSKYTGDLADTSLNGTQEPAQLQYQTESASLNDFTSHDAKDSDWSSSSRSMQLADGMDRGDVDQGPSIFSFNRHPPASATRGGYLYFMGDRISRFDSDGLGQSQVCEVDDNTAGQPRGLAAGSGWPGEELTVGTMDTAVSTYNIYSVDVDELGSCTYTKRFSVTNDFGGGRGMATHEDGDAKRYIIEGTNNNLDLVDTESGSITRSVVDLPAGHQRGLDVHEWPDGTVWFFVGYTTEGNQENNVIVVRKSDGNVIGEYSPASNSYNPVFNTLVNEDSEWPFTVITTNNNHLYATAPTYNWDDNANGKVVYEKDLSDESGISRHWLNTSDGSREVTWTIDAFDAGHKWVGWHP